MNCLRGAKQWKRKRNDTRATGHEKQREQRRDPGEPERRIG